MKKILWITWKDIKHPQAGGAEIVDNEIAKRMVKEGHQVIFLTGGFENCQPEEKVNGYRIIRLGNRFSIYFQVFRYYKKFLGGWADLVIEEVNTLPFFTRYYVREKRLLFFHQLCREKWLYEMFWPASWLGYFLEPLYLRLIRREKAITVSRDTRDDLITIGFEKEKIALIHIASNFRPQNKFSIKSSNYILSLNSIRPSKKTLDTIRAFEIAKTKLPELKLIVAGKPNGRYGRKVLREVMNSKYTDSIEFYGRVSEKVKKELIQKSKLVCAPYVKEGWGLVVAEANTQAVPVVAYRVSGLRESVVDNVTGLLCDQNPRDLAKSIIKLFNDQKIYERLSKNAWMGTKNRSFDQTYLDFLDGLKRLRYGQFFR